MAAAAQPQVFLGTAGSVLERTNKAGFRFYARKFRDGDGKQRSTYIAGPVGSREAEKAVDDMRARVAEVKQLVPVLRLLGREGFNLVDPKAHATIGTLYNHGVFEAGGILIGSHAYGVLLNKMGVRAAPYLTDDVDLARREALAFKKTPDKGLLEMLRETGIDFVNVPQLDRKKPPTSFKRKGKGVFHVDLLVPSPDETFSVVAVPELGAHATALPYLKYLLAESQPATLMAREGCCAVRVPLPERFAVHKICVSALRVGRDAKSAKDIHQASTLCAALADMFPGAVEEAVAALSKKMRKHFERAVRSVQPLIEEQSPAAWAELNGE